MQTPRTFQLATVAAALVGLTVSACGQTPALQAPAAATAGYAPDATVKDLMLGLVDTSADDFWLSVSTTVDEKGVHETRPQNDEDWQKVRYGALRLVEATNLLLIPGRRVARPGEKSEAPGIELEPEEMQAMIEKDPAGWNTRVIALRDAARLAVTAAEAKNTEHVLEVGQTIEHACEGCHKQYWYPNEKIPPLPKAP